MTRECQIISSKESLRLTGASATWKRPIESWELGYDSGSDGEGDKDSWDKSEGDQMDADMGDDKKDDKCGDVGEDGKDGLIDASGGDGGHKEHGVASERDRAKSV